MLPEKSKTAWPDPAIVARDVYTLVLENERVRYSIFASSPVRRL